MNWLPTIFTKALTAMRHAGRPPFLVGTLKRTRFDYRKEVGDGIDASVVTAPVQWVQRAFPDARLTIQRRARDGSVEEVADHGMLTLIARPNDYYGDIALWSATIFSYLTDGNAYWIKARNGAGRPAELWYVPHWTMEPKWPMDGSEYISHYLYSPGSGIEPIRIAPEDVVHFRHGIDPRNTRKGLSPLSGVIREIFMDLESSNFVASLLRNMGVPGVVISPKGGAMPSSDDVNATKAWFKQAFGGDRRGEPLVMGAPTDVQPYGFNPQQMNMSEARDIAEERVCASLGIPAAVVGFGAGLQQTKVGATMSELIKLAWQNGVLPVCRVFADELDRSLLPDFGNATGLQTLFDTSEVAALQDDLDKEATRWNTMIQGGWAQVAEGREAMGLAVDDSHRIYLRPAMALEVPAGAISTTYREPPKQLQNKARATLQQRQAGAAYVRALQQQERGLASAMEQRLKTFYRAFARSAKAAAKPLLDEEDLSNAAVAPEERVPGTPANGPKALGASETKADELLIERILANMGIDAHRTSFKVLYEAQYLGVAKAVGDAAELAGLGTGMPDPVARAVAGAGGRRAGLIDLSAQARDALFDAVAEGRSEGEGAAALADRIADHMEGGPWRSAETRARVVARTETKYAQNISTVERARAANVDRFIVFDGRLGPGRSDPEHIARDGSIVTADEAAQMAADEHPNGTLSFAPYFGEE